MNHTTHTSTSASASPFPDTLVTPASPSRAATLFFPDSTPQDLLWWTEPLLDSEHDVVVNQNEWTGRILVPGMPLEGVRIRPHSQLYSNTHPTADNWPGACDSLRFLPDGEWSSSLTFFDPSGRPTTVDAICTEMDAFNSFWESNHTVGRVATFRLSNAHDFPDDFPLRLLSLFGFPVLLPTGCSFSSVSDGPISNAAALHLYSVAVRREDGGLATGTCISSLGRFDQDPLDDVYETASAQMIPVIRETERWAHLPRTSAEVGEFAAGFDEFAAGLDEFAAEFDTQDEMSIAAILEYYYD